MGARGDSPLAETVQPGFYAPLGSGRGAVGPPLGVSFTGRGLQGGQQDGGRYHIGDDDLSMSSPTHSQQLGVTSAFTTRSNAIRNAYGDSFMN